MASPNSDVGPIASLLNTIDSAFVAAIVGLTAIGTLLRGIWVIRAKDLERLQKLESAVLVQRTDHERLAKLIEPLAGIDKRLEDMHAMLRQLVRRGD